MVEQAARMDDGSLFGAHQGKESDSLTGEYSDGGPAQGAGANEKCLFPAKFEYKSYNDLYELKLRDVLGEGRFSIICHASVHRKDPRIPDFEQVVAKILHLRSIASGEKKLQTFCDMFVKVAEVNIPTCIKVYHIFKITDHLVLLMKFAGGGNGRHFLVNNGPAPEEKVKLWMYQIGDALYHLHSRGIAHRNIRLSNILFDDRFNAYLSGFSSAKYCYDEKSKRYFLCKSYSGALPYMAPELFTEAYYEPRLSDVWSLGVCLYQFLMNRYPFDCGSLEILKAQQSYNAWLVKDYYKIITKPLEELLKKMFIIDPEKRPDIAEVLNSDWFSGYNHGNTLPSED